jgi:hypothetical protein
MFDKLKSLFQTIDVTAAATGFQETRGADIESSFADTQTRGDTVFGDTQFTPEHTNYYQCDCGQQWDNVAAGVCNDACPACGKDTAPNR